MRKSQTLRAFTNPARSSALKAAEKNSKLKQLITYSIELHTHARIVKYEVEESEASTGGGGGEGGVQLGHVEAAFVEVTHDAVERKFVNLERGKGGN